MTEDQIKWRDEQLEKKLLDYFGKNNYNSPGNSIGPHTILNGLKNENKNIILGISRMKDFLHNLNQDGKLKATQNNKYYLNMKNLK